MVRNGLFLSANALSSARLTLTPYSSSMVCSKATTRVTRPIESSTPSRPNSGVSPPSSTAILTPRPSLCSCRTPTINATSSSLTSHLAPQKHALAHLPVLCRLNRDRHPVLLQRPLRCRQNLDHPQPIPAIAPRLPTITDALEKVPAFQPHRLIDLQVWNRDVAKAERDVFGEGAVIRVVLRTLVVDPQLLCVLHVIEHHHLLAANDRHLSDLVRIEPAHVDVSQGLVIEIKRDEHDVLNAASQIGLPAGGDIGRLLAQQIQKDGYVVRREAPESVLVVPNRAEVHALVVQIVDVAELLGVDHPLEPPHNGVVLQQMANHQHAALLLGDAYQLLGLMHLQHDGLFDKDVLASSERRFGQGVVCRSRCRDDAGVQLRVRQKILESCRDRSPWRLPPQLLEASSTEIADILQRAFWDLVVVARQILSPASHAHDRDVQHRPSPVGLIAVVSQLADHAFASPGGAASSAWTIRSAARPFPNDAPAAAAKFAIPPDRRLSQVSTAAIMSMGFTPATMFPAPRTVSVHSVSSRSVTQGHPKKNASFCNPPESVSVTRA